MKSLKWLYVVVSAITREALVPVAVLLVGSVFPLVLLSYLWSGSISRVFEVMATANDHLQFYHIQLLLVPLFVVSLIEGLRTVSRIDQRMSHREAMKGLVVVPLVSLCAVVILMLMHAVYNYPREKIPLDGHDFAEGVRNYPRACQWRERLNPLGYGSW